MGSMIGGILSGVGKVEDAQQEEKTGVQQYFLGRDQDLLDQGTAASVKQVGAQQANAALVKGGQTVGAARTALATSGVDTQTGSAAEVQAATSKFSALDALTLENNAARSSWGYEVQGAAARAQGKIDMDSASAKANADELAGYGQIMSSVWGGATSTFGGGGS